MSSWRHDPIRVARQDRQRAWWAFRRSLGLSNVDLVARLLGVSVRSIQRYEVDAHPPAWYQAALLGLVESFPDRDVARKAKPKKPKKNARGYDEWEPEPKSAYLTWDPAYYKDLSIPR